MESPFEYEKQKIFELKTFLKREFTCEFVQNNKNFNWRSFTNYIPAQVNFVPWDLGWLGYRKDKLIPIEDDFIHKRMYSGEFLDLIDTELTLQFWRKVPFENCLNSLKVNLVKCVHCFHNISHLQCTDLSIGIFKTHKSTAGSVIWLSLRETQHFIVALIHFVELVHSTLKNKDWDRWQNINSSLRYAKLVKANSIPEVTLFTPCNLHKFDIIKDSLNTEEPILNSNEVTTEKMRNIDRKKYAFMWRRINSLRVSPYAPSLKGPYFIRIYKAFGCHPFNTIYVSVFEVQHLIIKLIILLAEGVECLIERA